jgi:hypothetical protein
MMMMMNKRMMKTTSSQQQCSCCLQAGESSSLLRLTVTHEDLFPAEAAPIKDLLRLFNLELDLDLAAPLEHYTTLDETVRA